ncbi:biopolymer transporter ExbD [Paucibacter sp. APW11]|uniref:Biopolymer transporter ExbD n=1 Tax=Roseateles aquae TaxID=3077235 RepID=A0ABU3PA65_9BURK|nr:biopolymer transporter ExbD [Paucibacter sp. APW11]MDT8999453.1 biopolymer transporter ExbD [Paucibacter sp. APW11]
MSFGGLERRDSGKPMGEINMTPLIDVMLVLLVIFMISAPLMTSSLRLDLPQSGAATPSDAPQSLAVAINAAGELFIGDDKLPAAQFQQRLQQQGQARPDTEVQLRADKGVPYGQVAELIGWVQAAGMNRIAFVAEPAAKP